MVTSGRSTKRSSHTDLSGLPDPQSAVPASPAEKPEGVKKRKKSSSKEKKRHAGYPAPSIHDLKGKIPKKSEREGKDNPIPDLGIVPSSPPSGAASANVPDADTSPSLSEGDPERAHLIKTLAVVTDPKAHDVLFEMNREIERVAAATKMRREVLKSPKSHEELIEELVQPLDSESSVDSAVQDKAYAFAQAKLRTVIPKIPMHIMDDMWVKPDQAIPRLYAVLERTDQRLWFDAVSDMCPEEKISLHTIRLIRKKSTDPQIRFCSLMRHVEETFRPYNAHEIAAKEFSDVHWDKHLHEPYIAFALRALNYFKIAMSFLNSEMTLPQLVRKIWSVLPEPVQTVLFQAKDLYAREAEMYICAKNDYSWLTLFAEEVTLVLVNRAQMTRVTEDLKRVNSATGSSTNLSALAVDAGVDEEVLRSALAHIESGNTGNEHSKRNASGDLSKRAQKKARQAASRSDSDKVGSFAFVKKTQDVNPVYKGDRGKFISELKDKYDAVDPAIWKERSELISNNVKLDRVKHAKFFKLDRGQVDAGNGKPPFETFVCVKCWKTKHNANFCSSNMNGGRPK